MAGEGMPDIEAVLPHRAPVRLIDALESCDGRRARATTTLTAGEIAIAEGRTLESALVECVAQTGAAMRGWKGTSEGRAPGMGMLCGVSGFEIRKRPAAGRRLEIEVEETQRLGRMFLMVGRVFCEGEPVASGELKLMDGEEETRL